MTGLQTCEFSCLYGLLYVISGLLAGGSPGFRIALCCFTLTTWYGDVGDVPLVFCLVYRHTQYRDDTMLSLLTIYLTLLNWPADRFLSRVSLVLLFFGFWLCFVFCLVFVCGCFFWIVTAPWTMYRSSPAHLFEAFDE